MTKFTFCFKGFGSFWAKHVEDRVMIGSFLSLTDSLPPSTPAPLSVPDMMMMLKSQLEGFNRSLEHLSRQVWDLTRDVTELKSSRLGAGGLKVGPVDGTEPETVEEELLSTRVEEVMEQVRDVQQQLTSQRTHLERSLHSQHAMLHYNLTTFKTDVDTKLKRHQKMLQVCRQPDRRGSHVLDSNKPSSLIADQPAGHECHAGRAEAGPGAEPRPGPGPGPGY